MNQTQKFTALIEREDGGYVALCHELDIASQGDTAAEARNNLIEAIALFYEVADPTEIATRQSTFRQSELPRSRFER